MPETDCDWFLEAWAESFDGSTHYPPHSIYQMITSPIHQMGKTSFALREAEIVSERLLGVTHYDIRNVSFTIKEIMHRRKEIAPKTVQVLDEPQRAAGARNWQQEAQNILAEDLMASNRYLKPVLMPTPLNAMIDNRLFEISTSQAVIPRKAYAQIYYLDRPQLDRKKRDPRTPKFGELSFDKPSAVLWHEYTKAFNDDYEKRNAKALNRVDVLDQESSKEESPLMADQLTAMIMQDPQAYIGERGAISPSKVRSKFKVPYNRAQEAATDATEQLRAREALEKAEQSA